MGASISRYRDVKDSEQLTRFVSEENLGGNDAFFDDLLGYNLKPTRNVEDLEVLEAATQSTIKEFVENNSTTNNLNHLIANILTHQVKESDEASLWRAFNGLNFVNYIIKSVIKEDETLDLIEVFGNIDDLTSFVNYLVDNLIEIEATPQTYHILLVSTTLLVSILMYSSASIKAGDKIIPKLLQKFITQQPAPVFPFGQTGGIGFTLASGMWSVMTVGMSSLAEKPDLAYRPLATVSLALLLFLTKRNPDNTTNENREILARINNNDVNLSDLHYTLLTQMNYEGSDQLFQRLLVENFFYRRFVVVATDLSALILPLLHSIYQRSQDNALEVEKSITILRILSMDELFCQAVHSSSKVNAGQVSWYKDKSINNMTLGGFVIIVLLRAILQTNITAPKEHMHKHYLTVLSNMSGHFRHLSPYVSERIISTIESLRRKQVKLNNANDTNSGALVEEVLATLLFLTNNCLVLQTEYNPNLIYTLLYKKDILENFGDSKLVKSLIENFKSIIKFVSDKIDKQTAIVGRGLQPEEVLLIASNSGKDFPKEEWNKISILNTEEEPESNTMQDDSVELSTEDKKESLSEELIQIDQGTCKNTEYEHQEQQDDVEEPLVREDKDEKQEEGGNGIIKDTLVVPEILKEELIEVDTPATENEHHMEEFGEKIVELASEILPQQEEIIVKEEDRNDDINKSEASVEISQEYDCVEEQEKDLSSERVEVTKECSVEVFSASNEKEEVKEKSIEPLEEEETDIGSKEGTLVDSESVPATIKEVDETEKEELVKGVTLTNENKLQLEEKLVESSPKTSIEPLEEEETDIGIKEDTLVDSTSVPATLKGVDETEKEELVKVVTLTNENKLQLEEKLAESSPKTSIEPLEEEETDIGIKEDALVDSASVPATLKEVDETEKEELVKVVTLTNKNELQLEEKTVESSPKSSIEPLEKEENEIGKKEDTLVDSTSVPATLKEEDIEKEELVNLVTLANENELQLEEKLLELSPKTLPKEEETSVRDDSSNDENRECEVSAELSQVNHVEKQEKDLFEVSEEGSVEECLASSKEGSVEECLASNETEAQVKESPIELVQEKQQIEQEKDETIDSMDGSMQEEEKIKVTEQHDEEEPTVSGGNDKQIGSMEENLNSSTEIETIQDEQKIDIIEKEYSEESIKEEQNTEDIIVESSSEIVKEEICIKRVDLFNEDSTESSEGLKEKEIVSDDIKILEEEEQQVQDTEVQTAQPLEYTDIKEKPVRTDNKEILVDSPKEVLQGKQSAEVFEKESSKELVEGERLDESLVEPTLEHEQTEVIEKDLDKKQILEEKQVVVIENSSEESIAELVKGEKELEEIKDSNTKLLEAEETKIQKQDEKHMEKKIIIKESVQVASHEIIVKDDVLEIVSIQDIKKLVPENAPILTNVQSHSEVMSEKSIDICQKESNDENVEQKLLVEKISENENLNDESLIETSQYEDISIESTSDDTIKSEHQTLCVSGSITNDDKKSSVTFIIDGENLHGKIFDKNIKIIIKDFIIVEENRPEEQGKHSDDESSNQNLLVDSEVSDISIPDMPTISPQSQVIEENTPIIERNINDDIDTVSNIVEDNQTEESKELNQDTEISNEDASVINENEGDANEKGVEDIKIEEVDVIEESNDIGELDVNDESSVIVETSEHDDKIIPEESDTSLVVEVLDKSEYDDKPVAEAIANNESSVITEGSERSEHEVKIVSEVELEISVQKSDNENSNNSEVNRIEEIAVKEIIKTKDLNKNEEETSGNDIKIAFTNDTLEERDIIVEENTPDESTLMNQNTNSSEPEIENMDSSETSISESQIDSINNQVHSCDSFKIEEENKITKEEFTEETTETLESPSDNNVTEKIEPPNEKLDVLNTISNEGEEAEIKVDSPAEESKPHTQICDEGYTSEKSADEQDEDHSLSDEPDEIPLNTRRVQPVPIHHPKSVAGAPINIPFKDIQIDTLATNLNLGGSQIKFELFSHMRIKPVVNASPQANIVWKRTDSNKM